MTDLDPSPTSAPVGAEAAGPPTRFGRFAGRLGRVLLVVLVPAVVAGGLVSIPLNGVGLLWPTYLVIGLAGLLCARPAVVRATPPVALLTFWVVLAAYAPVALAITPDPVTGGREMVALASCGVLSVAALLATRGTRGGLVALRCGWALALALSVGLAGWELTSKQHLWIDERHPWLFGDTLIAVGTFINPNNFAGALIAMIAGTLALARSVQGPARPALRVLAAAGGVVLFLTGSRPGLIGLVLLLAAEAWQSRRVLRAVWGRPAHPVLRRTWQTVAVGAAIAVVAASFVLPALAVRNPIRRMVLGWFDPATVSSDDLRADLIRTALRFLADSSYLGSGAGSFEYLLRRDPYPHLTNEMNLHNSFLEVITQYGVVVGAAFVFVLVAVLTALLRPARRPIPARDADPGAHAPEAEATTRFEGLGYLASFVAFGVSASSAVPIQTWWLALAAATACAWRLRRP